VKICMLASSYPRYEGDIAGTFVKSLAASLVASGQEVHILAPDDGPLGPTARRADPAGVIEHWFAYAPLQRLRVLGYAKSLEGDRRLRRLAYLMIVPYVIAASARLRSLAVRYRYDLIHAHWALPNGPIAATAARYLHRPLVISLHGSDVYVAEKTRPFRAVAGWGLKQADWVTACSLNLRLRAIKLGAEQDRAVVIPYGVSPAAFERNEPAELGLRRSLGIAESDPLVLALGRLVYKKGFEYLVDAMPKVLEGSPAAKLVLAGDGYLAQELRARAETLQIDKAVRMPGRVPSNQVPTYMAAADVFVVPSVTDVSGNVDGLPNVVLEAMGAGKAVVATRVGGIPEVIANGDTGLLVDERSPDGLARAILHFLANPEERSGCGARARRLVEQELNWTVVAQRFVDVYRAAIAQYS